MERTNPSFIGRRQQHINFTASLAMEFTPQAMHQSAGLALLQNDGFQIRCIMTKNTDNDFILRLTRRDAWTDSIIAEQGISPGRIYLKVEARGQAYQFFAADRPEEWQPVGNQVDGRVLSTPVAGGFTGAYLGMYASSNGNPADNFADFDYFEYKGIR
jgi:alpha-N-arabinofuranosidase